MKNPISLDYMKLRKAIVEEILRQHPSHRISNEQNHLLSDSLEKIVGGFVKGLDQVVAGMGLSAWCHTKRNCGSSWYLVTRLEPYKFVSNGMAYPKDVNGLIECLGVIVAEPRYRKRLDTLEINKHPIWVEIIANWDRFSELHTTNNLNKLEEEFSAILKTKEPTLKQAHKATVKKSLKAF